MTQKSPEGRGDRPQSDTRSGPLIRSGSVLALEWDGSSLYAVQAELRRGCWHVSGCLHAELPADLDGADADSTGQWLRHQLDTAGMEARRTVVTVPRKAVALRQLQVPDVPVAEMRELVRLQATANATNEDRGIAVDFVLSAQTDSADGKDLLLATMPQPAVDSLTDMLESAGLRLLLLTPAPVAVAELVRHSADSSEHVCELVLVKVGHRLELSVLHHDELTFSHAARAAGSDTQAAAQAIEFALKRVAVLEDAGLRGSLPERIRIVGTDSEMQSLTTELSQRLPCDISQLDPAEAAGVKGRISLSGKPTGFAAPVGALLLAGTTAPHAVNFVAPRTAAPPRSSPLRSGATVAVLLLCAIAALWSWREHQLAEFDRRIAQLTNQQSDIQIGADLRETILATAAELGSWSERRLNWMDELTSFTAEMPEASRAHITSLKCSAEETESLGRIKAAGYAIDREDVMEVNRRFLDGSERFELVPHAISPSERDGEFQARFDIEVRILQTAADDAPGRLPDDQDPNDVASLDVGVVDSTDGLETEDGNNE